MGARLHHRFLTAAATAGLLATAAIAAGGVARAADPEKVLSHFLCWSGVFPALDGPLVQLKDRFDEYDADVSSADLLCNPVKKTRGGE